MSNVDAELTVQQIQTPSTTPYYIEKNVFSIGRLVLGLSALSFISLLILIAVQLIGPAITRTNFDLAPLWLQKRTDGNFGELFLASYAIHIALLLVTLVTGFMGYRLVAASGAETTTVIPSQDRKLLSPLVADGKGDSIDHYVRLSSLSGFTGTFTKLGLTGLPLATIFMTLFFTCLTLYDR